MTTQTYELKPVKLSLIAESSTNPRGKDFENAAFKDLLASVREQGVLVPVILRPIENGKRFEVVAGNRRFRAARLAGLAEIPARVEELDDEKAREVQIIENLQREDVHPLDEGEAYRQLIEESGKTIKDIAVRVGKNEKYVRQRLFLANLTGPARTAYRKGEFSDSHAVLLAGLTQSQQSETLKWIKDDWETPTLEQLQNHIESEYTEPLKNQPWLKDKNAGEAVGPCTDCSPNRNTLFGERKEGECSDLNCWRKKMERYLAYQKEKHPGIVLVSSHYTAEDNKLLGRGNYETLSTRKKDHCDSATLGLVAEGEHIGNILNICADPKCKKHGHDFTPYQQTPEEKARRRKKREAEKAKKERQDKELLAALDQLTWPLTEQSASILLDLVFNNQGNTHSQPVGKRHGWKAIISKPTYAGGRAYRDWNATAKREAEKMDSRQKIQLALEMLTSVWDTTADIKSLQKLT